MWNYICSKVTGDEGSAPQIRRLYVLKIIITTIIGLVLLATLVVQMVKILTKYSEGPTYISTIIDHKKKAKFPAITICPNNVMYNTSRLKEHGFESAKDYNDARNGRLISWTSNTTLSPWDLFNYITMSSEEIIDSIILDVSHIRDGEGDSIVLNGSDSSLNAKGHRKFGRCWTFYPEENFRTRGINSVKMNFKADVKLYIHRNHQFLDLSGKNGIQSQFGGGKRGVWLHGVMDSTQKICDDFPNINKTFWIAWNRITNQEKDCPNPCDFFLINIGDKNFLRLENPNISYSSYYFASKVTLNEEHYLYSGLVLFAEIGGYTGLLLGLSFLNLSEIIAKLFQRKIDQYNREYQEFVFIQESQQKSRIA
ncbi:unnamed protein product [Lepeophtheirus salmonis]|uniref:(salmon louse) hypothetical protein n=1 Tax=Lepeophtheirus salmonis TaxID=72036 RepID=A0A7R8CJH2_LEPSM|nr:unnamed protein product [Lepeophtheirus salmonis]CAF2811273.1 unnamed protein product [Lepeophtheirus salmonis]